MCVRICVCAYVCNVCVCLCVCVCVCQDSLLNYHAHTACFHTELVTFSAYIAALPLVISAWGVKGPTTSAFLLAKAGTREAAAKMMKVREMRVGSSDSCFTTESPVLSSAPRAATKPSIARRPLMISGAPLKPITSASKDMRLQRSRGGKAISATRKMELTTESFKNTKAPRGRGALA